MKHADRNDIPVMRSLYGLVQIMFYNRVSGLIDSFRMTSGVANNLQKHIQSSAFRDTESFFTVQAVTYVKEY
jgi:hypothetical protein